MPSAPSVIYYDKLTVQTPKGQRQIWAPRERPWATLRRELLTDADLRTLMRDITNAILAEIMAQLKA